MGFRPVDCELHTMGGRTRGAQRPCCRLAPRAPSCQIVNAPILDSETLADTTCCAKRALAGTQILPFEQAPHCDTAYYEGGRRFVVEVKLKDPRARAHPKTTHAVLVSIWQASLFDRHTSNHLQLGNKS